MKKVRTEKVMANVTDYLKRRNLESSIVSSVKEGVGGNEATAEQQAGILGLVSPSNPNTFTFSTTSSQHSNIDHQYVRLKSWMMEASEPCRSELSQVLFPLFVHLYLELVQGHGKHAAYKFFKKHYQVFLVNRDYEVTLSQIINASGLNSGGDMNTSPIINNLKSGKYLVRLSELTLNYFLRYLKSSDNPTLLQIFNSYIEVEIDESGAAGSAIVFRSSDAAGATSNGMVNGHTENITHEGSSGVASLGMDCSQEELAKVKDVMNRVRIAQSTANSVCVYSVANAYNGLSCAKVNDEGKLLACGFEDSVIKIWRLSPPMLNVGLGQKQTLTSPRVGITHTLLACDESHMDSEGVNGVETEKEDEDLSVGRRRNKGGELWAFRGHSGPVLDVEFTHDSSHLLSVSEDTSMRLWDLERGEAICIYRGHSYPVWCLSVAPKTLYVATGSYDGTVRLWSTDSTYPLRTMAGHTKSVDCVAFHPNGTYIASGSSDRSVRLWQVADGESARIFPHHKAPINCLAFTPNGRYLASGGEDGSVVLWDLAAGRILCELGMSSSNSTHHNNHQMPQQSSGGSNNSSQHTDSVVSLCWSKDSNQLISASNDGCVRTSQLKKITNSDGSSSLELVEVGQVIVGSGNSSSSSSSSSCSSGLSSGNGGSLIHTSLTNQNYLTAVVALDVER